MEDDLYHIPQYLDEPERFFFLTSEEAAVVIAPVTLGIMFGHFMVGLVLAMVALYLYKKFVGRDGRSYLMYFKYWYLPASFSNLAYTPPSYKRFYQG